MPRLFTGIQIPLAVADELIRLQCGIQNARWISSENFHITLRFIGDVDTAIADDIFTALDEIAPPAFEINLRGVGAFGNNRPRMVWAGVAPSEPLTDLHRAHEQAMQRIGLKAEGRKFTPHVTTARLRHSTTTETADYLSLHGDFCSAPFAVNEFVVYSAKQSTGGGPYVIEEVYPLKYQL